MRAVFLNEFKSGDDIAEITGDSAHHLVKVVRIKPEEKILVLNGLGDHFECDVQSVSKKSVTVQILAQKKLEKKHNIDLALCPPKKDATADILKYSVELAINKVFPIESQYSQLKIENNERTFRLIESAMIQSNNPYLLEIEESRNFENLDELFKDYDFIYYFSSHSNIKQCEKLENKHSILIIIGPEAGLSYEEEEFLLTHKKVNVVHFDSWILRSQTAVCSAVGYVFGLMQSV
ncbi:RsmE family RNA methyltransferase [Halobacteriovorax sp. GB3]|uniref:RsmE family RNA methyltransferase n=1 Tax=Halobacteriovorax sp. GB3 TaxID=2719615 RepID=UPI002360B00A|nr:RsmE family RNA methyltransferase [Halobacteriovorax sp. GB3]MDD0854648.1 RsmE family RNA methyltransferase [Halobacteriovorax sp. GB3]